MTRSSDRRVWARLTVDFADSPKVAGLSDAAFRTLVEMILWSRKMMTDGVIPVSVARRRWGAKTQTETHSVTESLTESGTHHVTDPVTELCTNHPTSPSLVRTSDGDYMIHDFLDHQESAEEVNARLARNTANGRRGGRPRKTDSKTHSVTESLTESGTQTKPKPKAETETELEDEVLRTSSLSPTQSERGSVHDYEDAPEPTPIAEHRPDVDAVCDAMAASVNRRTGRTPRITTAWRTQARLMIDRDGRTVEEITRIIDWVDGNDFWRANVLSLPKLRQKFDTLRLQAQRPQGRPQGGQVFYDLAAEFAKEGL